jgi:hypothetical protein
MSAIVLEAVRQPHPEGADSLQPTARPHLVLVPTGRAAVRAARAAAPAIRLTRFGRLLRTLLVACVIALLGVGLAGQLASATGDPRLVTVQPGQTLSGIASHELPDLTIGDGVVQLQVANGLSTSQIHVGQQLVIPAH